MYEDGNTSCINGANNDGYGNSGSAYSYTFVSGNWKFVFKYKSPITIDGSDIFGCCVSGNSNGTCFVMAAGLEDGSSNTVNGVQNNNTGDAGAVFVFSKN
jgi:hypothetical protein